jgi:hypothetical protein
MEIKAGTMCANEIRKAALLITKAADIGMDVSGYGEAAANPYFGNVYLGLEDYPFTLYIGPSGGDTIYAVWSNPDNGEEETICAHEMTLHDLETWAEELAERAEVEA